MSFFKGIFAALAALVGVGIASAQNQFLWHSASTVSSNSGWISQVAMNPTAGNFITAGSIQASPGRDIVITSRAADGSFNWLRTIYASNRTQYVTGLAVNWTTGDIYVSGQRSSFPQKGFLIKLNSAGTVIWDHERPMGRDGSYSDVALLPNGDPVVCGHETFEGISRVHDRAYVARHDPATGAATFSTYLYEVGLDVSYQARFVKTLSNSRIVIGGQANDDDGFFAMLNQDCVPLSSATLVSPNHARFGVADMDTDPATGATYLVGQAEKTLFGGDYDAFAARFDAAGTVAWARYFEGPHINADSLNSCRLVGSNLVACGYQSIDEFQEHGWLISMNAANGTTNWEHFRSTPENPADNFPHVNFQQLDAAGNRIWVGGNAANDGSMTILATQFTANGTLLGTISQATPSYQNVYDVSGSANGSFVLGGAGSFSGGTTPLYWSMKLFDGVRTVSPAAASVIGGQNISLRVNFSDSLNAFGMTIQFSTNSPLVTPPGQLSATGTYAVGTFNTAVVATPTPVVVSARISGGEYKSATVTLLPRPMVASIQSLTNPLYGGDIVAGRVNLQYPNGPTPLVVNVSSNTTALTVPATVTIPAFAQSANFTINVGTVAARMIRRLYAVIPTVNGVNTDVELRPGLSTIGSPSPITGGSISTLSIGLQGVNAVNPTVVGLSVTGGSGVSLPSTMTIPAGQGGSTIVFNTSVVTAATSRTLRATLGTRTLTTTITIQTGPVLSTLAAPGTVTSNQNFPVTVTLSAFTATPRLVKLIAAAPLVAPDYVTVSGSNSLTFNVTAPVVTAAMNRNLSAMMGGVVKTVTIRIQP